ncbi:MAG TPA: hypothetical protein PLI40_04235 [Smithellaceae bacterium]|nr:hypothetical protein [Smithellaceae bacterium]
MTFLYILLSIIIVLIILELAMLFFVRHPNVLRKLWRRLQNSMGYLYVQGERKIMHFNESAGQYHPELSYTFKPGKFIFTEREFSNIYFINSLGVRDTEEALTAPEIVIVGDSFALGWGVDQEKTFGKLLEQRTGLKVLNTSVPSYGTVREMIMLGKVDRTNLKCLIIQYCGDDYDENLKFYLNGNKPQTMREETFHKLTEIHSRPKKYYFGKYIIMKIQKRINEMRSANNAQENKTALDEVDLFLHVLKQNEKILSSAPIIVLDLGGKNRTNYFIDSLKQKSADADNPRFIRELAVLKVMDYLKAEDFYVLDDHLNDHGHIVVADLLYKTLKDKRIIRS